MNGVCVCMHACMWERDRVCVGGFVWQIWEMCTVDLCTEEWERATLREWERDCVCVRLKNNKMNKNKCCQYVCAWVRACVCVCVCVFVCACSGMSNCVSAGQRDLWKRCVRVCVGVCERCVQHGDSDRWAADVWAAVMDASRAVISKASQGHEDSVMRVSRQCDVSARVKSCVMCARNTRWGSQ